MVDFVQLQNFVKIRLEQDRTIRTITVEGTTLDEAVAEASTLLDLPVRRLEYEVTERGSPGFLGSGKKNWKIKAYERVFNRKVRKIEDEIKDEPSLVAPVIPDKDGEVYTQLRNDGGAYIKVTPPTGMGKKAPEIAAIKALEARHVTGIDKEIVSAAIREMGEEYIRAGSYQRQTQNDTMVQIELVDQEMKAFMTVNPPGLGGCDHSMESYLSLLKSNRVHFGAKEHVLREFADKPIYRERILVAEGIKPANGRDAYIQYAFETDLSKVRLREGSNGRVDFKELNLIQNVVENQPVARKMPAEKGVQGQTVTSRDIPASNGNDIPLPLGKNVHVGQDGECILSDINGQVILVAGKINVEPVYTVDGGVNLKTGNIIFLGTVIINGNVEDGFSVKAAGNIEVHGIVEKAELDAEGAVIVHKGITGKNGGVVRAGKSIWARFIENAVVESGDMVVVADGIINSQVDAFKRVICHGKRASIVGSRVRASEEVNAKILGSPTGGAETICEVGVDPRSKSQLETLMAENADAEKEIEEIQRNLQTLINIKKQRKSLPEEKEENMKELMDRRQILLTDIKKNGEKIQRIHEFLNSLKSKGKVSASSKAYPGVKIIIKDAVNDIRTEYHAVTFILENGLIRVTKYEEPEEDVTKAPDGFTAN